ncbi:uncharacterized protein LOC102608535 isoform X2 [Citrus sinensis]|uniref:uncharacterized protein LOC102608535 isoform X2 n=1 Tax=Citrus sinensis TaxID=2711 RepID=UPI000D62CCDC|nr:uncharacterized protein LOC102608535 isoform X2 [Citrus sinensis]
MQIDKHITTLVKVGGLSDETCVKEIREMAETNLSINKASSKVDQSFVSNENHHMAILRRKMEGLSNGMLLERMNDEYGSMLLSMANSSAASSVPTPKRTEVPNVSSSPKEHPCKKLSYQNPQPLSAEAPKASALPSQATNTGLQP